MSWTVKRTNDWVLEKAEIKRSLLENVKKRKLSYFGHIGLIRKCWSLEKEIMLGTFLEQRHRGRPIMVGCAKHHSMDTMNI